MRQLTVDADRRLVSMEQETQRTRSELRRAEEKARTLETELVTTQQRAGEAEDELQRWRVRCDLLEKSRRLGYYHPGWSVGGWKYLHWVPVNNNYGNLIITTKTKQ